jgi:hypothetical protein
MDGIVKKTSESKGVIMCKFADFPALGSRGYFGGITQWDQKHQFIALRNLEYII